MFPDHGTLIVSCIIWFSLCCRIQVPCGKALTDSSEARTLFFELLRLASEVCSPYGEKKPIGDNAETKGKEDAVGTPVWLAPLLLLLDLFQKVRDVLYRCMDMMDYGHKDQKSLGELRKDVGISCQKIALFTFSIVESWFKRSLSGYYPSICDNS
jgi:hypothetical protein